MPSGQPDGEHLIRLERPTRITDACRVLFMGSHPLSEGLWSTRGLHVVGVLELLGRKRNERVYLQRVNHPNSRSIDAWASAPSRSQDLRLLQQRTFLLSYARQATYSCNESATSPQIEGSGSSAVRMRCTEHARNIQSA